MNKLNIIITTLIVINTVNACCAQYKQWGSLVPGNYKVGYRVYNRYDSSRYIIPKYDFEGNLNKKQGALPVQINIWYPATGDGKQMLYEEYAFISKQKETYEPLLEKDKQDALNDIRSTARFTTQTDLTDVQLYTIAKTPVAAIQNAPNAKGLFPVILAIPDGGGANTNNVLFEYLASYGYVVICVPSTAHIGSLQVVNKDVALAERIGTLEFMLRFIPSVPCADIHHLGVLGVNFDGMAALLFQMKNMQADAVVSLDGWEGAEGTKQSVIGSPFFDIIKMRVPYFLVKQDEKNPGAYLQLSETVFDSLLYANRYYYVLKEMSHVYLVHSQCYLPDLPDNKRMAYQFLYTEIHLFFDSYVKGSADALVKINQPAIEKGFQADMIKIDKNKKALPAAPGNEELELLFNTGQYDKLVAVVKKSKQQNPGIEHWGAILHLYGFRLMRTNKFKEAITILTLTNELYPGNPYWQSRLAEAYEASGDKENMQRVLKDIVNMLEAKTVLTDDEKALKENAERKIKS